MNSQLCKAIPILVGIILTSLLTGTRSAEGVELTFTLRGTFEDTSRDTSLPPIEAENTRFRSFLGTYSYDEDTPDQDTTLGIGLYPLTDFDIDIFDINGNNTLSIDPSNWSGQLELTSIDTGNGIGDPAYSLNFSRPRTVPDTFGLRITWDWFLEADVIPKVPPASPIRPGNSFLVEANDETGENRFYSVQAATVAPTTVPEPSFELGLLAFSIVGLSSFFKHSVLYKKN